jgi:hypothetical protein
MAGAANVLDPAVVERVQLARFELADGRAELAASTPSGAYKAIKTFHDALETFVVAVAQHVGVPPAFRQFHEYHSIQLSYGRVDADGTAFKP